MKTKFFVKVIERKTERELRYTSYSKPIDDGFSVSFTDRDGLYRNFPKELYIVQIEEMIA